jgi:hypothetical protein
MLNDVDPGPHHAQIQNRRDGTKDQFHAFNVEALSRSNKREQHLKTNSHNSAIPSNRFVIDYRWKMAWRPTGDEAASAVHMVTNRKTGRRKTVVLRA